MYAIIRTGGKQAKVHEGDVIDVERLRAEGEVSFTPLLVVDDAGTVFSHRDVLKGARVVARVVGDSAGPKVDLFKYKNKSGYRRHLGHRQKYTALEVTLIEGPAGAERREAAPKKAAAKAAPAAAEAAAAEAAAKPAAPKAKAVPKAKAAPKTKAAPKKAVAKGAPAAVEAAAKPAAAKAKAGAKKKES
jgi:large subunit ribosomal protein L21